MLIIRLERKSTVIVIRRVSVEVSLMEFKEELDELCEMIKKHSPMTAGINLKTINEHFGTKLRMYDFFILSEQLEIPVKRKNFWYFSDILE